MKRSIEANDLFRPFWTTRKRYVISIGGRGGARSYEASQKIIALLAQSKRLFRGAIMRAVHTDIRHSIWQELNDRVSEKEIDSALRIADNAMEMEHGRNTLNAHGFKRSSHERTAKLKSLAGYTDAFIEEAKEIAEDDFRQLDDSLRVEGSQIYLMLNTPAKSHWIIKRWFNLTPAPEAPGFYSISLKPEFAHEVEVAQSVPGPGGASALRSVIDR
jgi:phage terminase large subunit